MSRHVQQHGGMSMIRSELVDVLAQENPGLSHREIDTIVTIFFDEAHALPKEVVMVFLSIFNTEAGHEKTIIHKETAYTFDFKKQSFLFATTESDKIFAPFKDRLITVDFDNYSQADLSQIFLNNLVDITFEADALDYISSTFRGNARNCVQRVKDIQFYKIKI